MREIRSITCLTLAHIDSVEGDDTTFEEQLRADADTRCASLADELRQRPHDATTPRHLEGVRLRASAATDHKRGWRIRIEKRRWLARREGA